MTTAGNDRSKDSILVFSAGSSGNASPARMISGAASRVRMPGGIAVSAKGYIYVTTEQVTGGYNGVEILIFGPGTNGDTAPVTRIDGGCDPSVPTAGPVALGSDNRIYVLTTELSPEKRKIVAFMNEVESALNTKLPPYLCGNYGASVPEWNSGLVDSYSFAVDPTGNMYLADSEQNTVSILPAGSNGEVKPVAKFGGDSGIVAPTGVALDAQGKIYVANDGVATGHPESDNVTIYPAGSNAIAAPIGGSSNYSSPQAIAVGLDGTTYVANGTGGVQLRGDISIVPPSLEGKAKVRMIVAGLDDPSGLAADHAGNLYVVNSGNQSMTVYGPNADGKTPPIRTISGEKTKLNSPVGIAIDTAGKIYVTNDGGISPEGADSITIYARGSSGNIAPVTTIAGPKTQLKLPQGIAVDSDGKIYVANDGNLEDRAEDAQRYDDRPRADPADSITVYAPGSNGNVAPIARINGPLTGLGHPMGIAVGP